MPYPLREELEKNIEFIQKELSALRTGRASPALVENIMVPCYESQMPLNQLANILVPEPRSLVIEPWDKSIIKSIEKALQISDIGVSPVNEGTQIRVVLPPLTEERRESLLKIMNKKLEEARIAIRTTREHAIKAIRTEEANGEISEDDFFRMQKEIQKSIDEYMEKVQGIGEKKKKEITTI